MSVPTLMVWGEQDIALGIELTMGLERWVNGLTIQRIADSGHGWSRNRLNWSIGIYWRFSSLLEDYNR